MARRRINITLQTERKAANLLLSLVPKDGSAIGNTKLSGLFLEQARRQLKENLGEEVYWQVRNGLIENGVLETGRGKGGSVRLAGDTVAPPMAKRHKRQKERLLYDPFYQSIQTGWVKQYDITDYVSEVSAYKGRKATGGKWTRPDVTLVSVATYAFIFGKIVEVITFEIKPAGAHGLEGVYETASHSAYANKSYLALHFPDGTPEDYPGRERLEQEAVRFEIGLVTFEDPARWDTFNVVIEAKHQVPNPRDTNTFLSRLKTETKERLSKLLK